MYVNVRKHSVVCGQNVYTVYKMHVISQNSRRKVIAEGQATDYRGYCVYMLKQLKLPPHPVSQIGWSLWLKNLPHTYCYALVRLVKKNAPCLGSNVSAGNGPRCCFRARQAAATLLLKYKYGRSFLLAYIEKMAACRFTRSFVWHSSAQNIYAKQIKSRRWY
jgi:hypothetical protein